MKWHERKGVEHTQDYESQQKFSSRFPGIQLFLRLSKQASTSNELIFSSMDVEKTCDGLQKKKTKMIFHGHGCRKKWSFVYPH